MALDRYDCLKICTDTPYVFSSRYLPRDDTPLLGDNKTLELGRPKRKHGYCEKLTEKL